MKECSSLTHSRMEAQSLFTPLPAPPSPPPVYHSPTPIHPSTTSSHTHKLIKEIWKLRGYLSLSANSSPPMWHGFTIHMERKVLIFRADVISNLVKITFQCHLGWQSLTHFNETSISYIVLGENITYIKYEGLNSQ